MTALMAGAVFAILAVAILGLFLADYQGQRTQQQSVQAYWNARSGLARYLASGHLPEHGVWELGPGQRCLVLEENGDVVLEGVSGSVHRRLRCLGADPARVSEDVGP